MLLILGALLLAGEYYLECICSGFNNRSCFGHKTGKTEPGSCGRREAPFGVMWTCSTALITCIVAKPLCGLHSAVPCLSESSRCLPPLLLTSLSFTLCLQSKWSAEGSLNPDKCYKSPPAAALLHRPLTGHVPTLCWPPDLVAID